MDTLKDIRPKIREIKEFLNKEKASFDLTLIDESEYNDLVTTAKTCNKILKSQDIRHDSKVAQFAQIYLDIFEEFKNERLKKILRFAVSKQDPSSLKNASSLEKELYSRILENILWFEKQLVEDEEEYVLISITSNLKEPILDLDGRFLTLSTGDILRTKKRIADHLVNVGIATYIP